MIPAPMADVIEHAATVAPSAETCAQCAAPILAGQECWNMATPTCGPCFTGTNPTQKENTNP